MASSSCQLPSLWTWFSQLYEGWHGGKNGVDRLGDPGRALTSCSEGWHKMLAGRQVSSCGSSHRRYLPRPNPSVGLTLGRGRFLSTLDVSRGLACRSLLLENMPCPPSTLPRSPTCSHLHCALLLESQETFLKEGVFTKTLNPQAFVPIAEPWIPRPDWGSQCQGPKSWFFQDILVSSLP